MHLADVTYRSIGTKDIFLDIYDTTVLKIQMNEFFISSPF